MTTTEEQMRIMWNGNVGINTSAPTAMLDVRSDGSGDLLNIYDNTTHRVTVLDSGNVGINTDTPVGPIHAVGASGQAWVNEYGHLVMQRSGEDYWTVAPRGSAGELSFGYGTLTSGDYVATSMMAITQAGNVGIGIDSPGYLLEVDGSFQADSMFGAGLVDCDVDGTDALLLQMQPPDSSHAAQLVEREAVLGRTAEQ